MSVKETSVCVVDDLGKIVREVKVASEPKALLAVLKNPAYRFERIGLEAGPLSQWLYSAVAGDADQKGQVAVRLVDLRLRQLISLNRRRFGTVMVACCASSIGLISSNFRTREKAAASQRW